MTYYVLYECDLYDRGRQIGRRRGQKMVDADTPEAAEERFREHAKSSALKNAMIVSVNTTNTSTYK